MLSGGAAPAIEVRAETSCPRAEEVVAALARMLGGTPSGTPGDVVELREEGESFVITLRRAGDPAGEKRVPSSLACGVRAEVAAVAIAAFEAQLGGLELAPPPAPPPPAPSPPPLSPPAAAVVATSPPPPDAVPVSFEVGAAVLVSLDGRDAAPAARADAKVRPGAGPWAFAVAATGVGKHWLDVSGGHGTWRRLGGELAVVREIGTGEHARLEVRAGLALALIDIQGNGYRRNLGATLFDQGAVMGLRFAPFAWRVRPWLDVAGTYWPRVHQVSVDTAPFPGAVEHNYGVGPAQTLRLTPAR